VRNTPCKVCGKTDRDKNGNCAPCGKIRGREWARAHKDVVNPKNRLKKYKLTQEQLDQMFLDQKGLCPICQKPLLKKYHIDHDHAHNVVRGLLCFNCNAGLGQFKENSDILLRASEYIKFYKALLKK